MNKGAFIVPTGTGPNWLEYPPTFQRILDQGLVHLAPWHILESARALVQFEGLARRYPTKKLFPFAYRQDNDDVACWAEGTGERVFVIHDFASPGWEAEATFEDMDSWLRAAQAGALAWE